jgi:DNA repair protein RecN (Recombination protein N)
MLVSLSVRDVVLIDRLDLSFEDGLSALTGETGAGKSILLDALGLALGARADAGLLRSGASQASVAVGFELDNDHPALGLLAEHGLTGEDGGIVLRRVLSADGRSRAFINDQPVSVGLLRQLGDSLVEIQGQFEQRGLLDPTTHRTLLDAFGGHRSKVDAVAAAWQAWRAADAARVDAARELDEVRRDEAFLRHAVDELDTLDPQPGDEETLAAQRSLLMNAEKLIEATTAAAAALSDSDTARGAEGALANARNTLERVAGAAGGRLDSVIATLDRALLETEEALVQIQSVSSEIELDSGRLDEVEERLFALRDLARKHGTEPARLPALRETLRQKLAEIDSGGERLAALDKALAERRAAYVQAAEALSTARRKTAKKLDRAVAIELPPLKLDKAKFHTRIEPLEETAWGPHGLDRIAFEVATNPGDPPGPLAKIASGGELARFQLALKVALAEIGPSRTMIFDEVDSGIGGATAHAVGERLAQLTRNRQVLVVTHSPQVGARATHHLRVRKEATGKRVATRVSPLSLEERREEIARMLAGAEVTDEARAAARRLIDADAR